MITLRREISIGVIFTIRLYMCNWIKIQTFTARKHNYSTSNLKMLFRLVIGVKNNGFSQTHLILGSKSFEPG